MSGIGWLVRLLIALVALHGAAAQAPALTTLCDDDSSFGCTLYEYLRPPTAAELEAKVKAKKEAVKRLVQARVFGVRVGWDRAWHALKDVGGVGVGAVGVFHGGAFPKPALLLQAAALSSSAIDFVPHDSTSIRGDAARTGLALMVALTCVHIPVARAVVPLGTLAMFAARTLTAFALAALPKDDRASLQLKLSLGAAAMGALLASSSAAGALSARLIPPLTTLPAGIPLSLAASAVTSAFLLVECLSAHITAEWLHIIDALGGTVIGRILPAAAQSVRAVLRVLWTPFAILLKAVSRALAASSRALSTLAVGSLKLSARGGIPTPSPPAPAHQEPCSQPRKPPLCPSARHASQEQSPSSVHYAGVRLLLRVVAQLLHGLAIPLRYLFPKALATAIAATRSVGRAFVANAAAMGRVLSGARRIFRLITAPKAALETALGSVRANWGVVLPWILGSCGIALQMGLITASQANAFDRHGPLHPL